MEHPGTLVLIMALAVLAPLLGYATGRWLPVPVVIFEIVLGVLVGPDVLGWAHHDQVIDALSDLGLSMLIFLAGYEIKFAEVRGDTLRRVAAGPGSSRSPPGSASRCCSAGRTWRRAWSSVPR